MLVQLEPKTKQKKVQWGNYRRSDKQWRWWWSDTVVTMGYLLGKRLSNVGLFSECRGYYARQNRFYQSSLGLYWVKKLLAPSMEQTI